MNATPPETRTRTRPKPIMWVLAIGSIIAILSLCCGVGGLFFAGVFFLDDSATETDFATDPDRIKHLNQTLPFVIPANATTIRFTHQGFQDDHIDLEFTLPINEVDLFLQSLPPLDQPTPNHYEGKVGYTYLTVEVDPVTGEVHLVWFET